ncbi:MAG: hypothetical protein K9G76_05890 [Bacteroidales bacterium]|nr:hypothetical protein [Bacteroidales bacterium]MCF8402441.1 hypothetical protein [Bacteroidales bacterium]
MKKIILLIFLFGLFLTSNSQTSIPPAGSGTSGDPFQISSLENLYWLSQTYYVWYEDTYFIQTADINASETSTWFGGKGWEPIGETSILFKGVYDGNHHIIDSLYINRSNEDEVGLFAHTNAIIKNLGVTNVYIRGDYQVGAIIGYSLGIYGNTSYISNCYSTGTVIGDRHVGGLVGSLSYYSARSNVNNCYSECTVSGRSSCGGLIGYSYRCWVTNNYAKGSVSGDYDIGGLVGEISGSGGVVRCYSTGAVSGVTKGGLIGSSEANITYSFWDIETSGCTTSAGGTGKTTAEMKTLSTYTSETWDFMIETENGVNDFWGINALDNEGYPFLDWQGFLHAQTPLGEGSLEAPYQIEILENLYWMSCYSEEWDMHYIQMNDIDADTTSYWHNGQGFIPIGTDPTRFTGSYDGQGYTIDGLSIDRSESNVGFFGFTQDAEISNLILLNVDFTGSYQTGALVGNNYSSIVTNCGVTGSVSGYDQTGGLLGYNQSSSSVNYCYADVAVSGNQRVGGLVGYNLGSSISNSYALGEVTSSYRYAGGFCGMNLSGASISDCYSIGSVDCSGTGVGGLVGYNGSTVNTSFWDMETSGESSSAGGTGKTTAEMKTSSTYIDAGWIFPEPWQMDETVSPDNNGYPSLEWQGLNLAMFSIVTTQDVSQVGLTTATGNGNITFLGFPDPIDHGVCWSTEENPTIDDNKTSEGIVSATGAFTSGITGLSPSTKYYVRAYATNNTGTSYGEQVQFTTLIGGTGTIEDPYQIGVLENLQWLSQNSNLWNMYFIQIADIDASATITWNNGEGFSTIGNSSTNFTGTYDGQGHTIDSLFISINEAINTGMFGLVIGATIKNLGLTNVNITSTSAGYLGTGALAGYCNLNCTIENCFSTGSVSGNMYVGGLIGRHKTNSLTQNCYSTASVTGSDDIGGLFGYNSSSHVENCYSTGIVNSTSKSTGGLIGASYNGATCINSFWDMETSGQTSSGGGVGKTTAEMKTLSTFVDVGWDFPNTWHIDESTNPDNIGYPSLAWQGLTHLTPPIVSTQEATSITGQTALGNGTLINLGYPDPSQYGICWSTTPDPDISDYKTTEGTPSGLGTFTSLMTGLSIRTTYYARAYATNDMGTSYGEQVQFTTSNTGQGTLGDPYQVSILDDLEWISLNPDSWDKYFIQTANIDASSTSIWNNGDGFSPIGNPTTSFSGSYDGQGYSIEGLAINRPSADYNGFFGYATGASLNDIRLSNADIMGRNQSGGLIGYNYSSGSIDNCSVTGMVTGFDQTGGLVGYNHTDCVINNCFSDVAVSGNQRVGGLVGYNYLNSQISNCYALGSIIASYRYAGGFAGQNMSSAEINKCYSIGTVSCSGDGVGGFLGYNGSTVSDSFWDTETSGRSNSAGGTGKTTSQMKGISTFTTSGWDYCGETANGTDDEWTQDGTTNNGYPFFTGTTAAWTGYTSSDWNTTSNWHNNSIPETGDIVSIGCCQNSIEIDGTLTCDNDINITSPACLTVKPTGKLTLNGNVNNKGSIHIQAYETGTGSLINNSPNLQATIDCYFEEDQWHAITPPVSNALAGVFEGSYLKFYSEPDSVWTYINYLTTPLFEGRGYFAWNYENQTVSYSGLLNSGDFNPNLSYTSAAQHEGKGWNLVGNPYPSYINYDGSWPSSNVDETIYLYDGTQYVTWNGSVGAHGSGEIAPGQAFWVHANADNPGLTIPDAKRMHGTQTFYKNESSDCFFVKVTGNGYDDLSFVSFNDMATLQFDTKWDGYKLFGSPEAPQLYTLSGNTKLAVNTLPKKEEISVPLSIVTGIEGIYTLASNSSEFSVYNHVYLEDKFKQIMTDLKAEDSYIFYAHPEDDHDRFILHFTPTEKNSIAREAVTIYAYNNTVYVFNPSMLEGVINVYDLLGRKTTEKYLSNKLHTLEMPQKGYFVVHVISGNSITSEKVWIR